MSHNCKCAECGTRRKVESLTQLHEHDGPWFEHWRRGMAASVGAIIPDRLDTNPEQR